MAASSSFSSDSNPTPPWKYHVFLSFRGEDTRLNFTDHLYKALQKRFKTFRDDEELEKGEVIKPELLQAIEESLSSIVVLSQNYASSSWCLDELQQILKSKKTLDRVVLPIFYGVNPSDVRNQRGSFAEAFRRHEKRFGEDNSKVQNWKQALSEVADLSGYDSKDQFETELIEEIITQLGRKLRSNLSSFTSDGFVGIDRKIKDMRQILEIGSDDVRFVGIWGMGGLGKTTLATLLFNQISSQFDMSCCLENVREKSNQVDGLLCLQKQLLSHLEIMNLKIANKQDGKAKIRNLLCHKRVLLVLDDVDRIEQLEHLAGMLDWFGKGSRVIVTARDSHLFDSHKYKVYEIEALNKDESLELFCRKAFGRNQPKEGYLELSELVVRYADGLPLALEVLGLHLCGRDISICEDAIDRLKNNPPKGILDVLRISYEGLEDGEKNIFLDIACFFKGWHIDRVIQILENCGYNHKIGIDILTKKSLLRCQNQVFWMHDLLQEMGRDIVIKKSNHVISEQSRLWSLRDIDEVLGKNMGTDSIEGIVLEEHNHEACWDPKAFSKMSKLRVLIISHGFPLSVGLECLPDSIKVLEWNGYPFKFLPHCVQLRKLVELKMHDSKIKQLWDGIQNFENLKFIDLSYSKDLIRTPNLSRAPNLETLILKGCLKLVEVHQAVGQLKKLVVLNLEDCSNLKRLPSKLETYSLKDLILSGCSRLEKLPEFGENMKEISVLDLSENAITEIPSFPSHLKLKRIYLRGCRWLASNSWPRLHLFWWKSWGQKAALSPLSGLTMLKELDARFCNLRDGSILDDFSCLPYLEKLNLSGNDFANLPLNCISNLSRLWELNLGFCPELQSLPVFPSSLRQVSARNCGPMDVLPNEELSKLFMFDDAELRKPVESGLNDRRPYVIYIPGSEIPTWFDTDKQKNFPLYNSDRDPRLLRSSFIVDIPDYCLSNNCKWWGIVVCFLFEPMICAQPRDTKHTLVEWLLFIRFESPETEVCKRNDDRRSRLFTGEDLIRGLNFHHQYIILLSGNDEYIQEVLRDGHNQLRIFFGTPILREDLISKCAWRVIYKDENIPSTSNSPRVLNRPRIKEISTNEDGATTSDEELPAEKRKLKQKILD